MAKTDGQAMVAGQRWAEREAEAAYPAPRGAWRGTAGDALPLIDHEDDDRRRELAEIANDAAAKRWATLVNAGA